MINNRILNMSKDIDNQIFINLAKELKNTKGYSFEKISKAINMKYSRFTNIMYNRTSAKQNDINLLRSASLGEDLDKDQNLIKEIETLHIENQQLKQQLFEAIKEKDLKQETIDKLLEILKNHK